MNSKDGIILWTLGAAGTLLIYAAIKNTSPASILAHYATPATPQTPLAGNNVTANTAATNAGINPTPVAGNNITSNTAQNNYIGRDSSGTAFLYNAQGYQIAQVPAAYQANPASWIPARQTLVAY